MMDLIGTLISMIYDYLQEFYFVILMIKGEIKYKKGIYIYVQESIIISNGNVSIILYVNDVFAMLSLFALYIYIYMFIYLINIFIL